MRIGLISPPWVPVPPPAYGGTEAVVDCLARGLVAAGHEVVLAAPSDSTCPVPRLEGMAPSDAARMGQSVVELSHVVRSYDAIGKVDLIHDHTVVGPLYGPNRPAVPLAVTAHGPFLAEFGEVYRAVGRDAALIAISRHHASTARGARVARVIYHGIDLDQIQVGAGAGGYACFLGRMHPCKGPREAILVAREVGIPLLLAAKMREKEEKEYFDQVIAPLLGPDAQYVGELGSREKYELLAGAVALVNPIAWDEPFGLVMVEALAAGTPVVATPAGSAPELVRDGVTGYVRRTVAGLATALAQVGDLDRSRCRREAEERFSIERMVADHLELYQALLNPPRRLDRHGRAPVVAHPHPHPVVHAPSHLPARTATV